MHHKRTVEMISDSRVHPREQALDLKVFSNFVSCQMRPSKVKTCQDMSTSGDVVCVTEQHYVLFVSFVYGLCALLNDQSS